MQGFVIVSGLPASGKSTLARSLAQELDLPLLDKDDLLEALFPTTGVHDEAVRRDLSRRADTELQEAARRFQGAVVTSWWRHPSSTMDSGTLVEWLSSLRRVVEVYCRCSPVVAASRFLARSRHPGHLDGLRTHAELLETFKRQASLGPLGLRRCVVVDTEFNAPPERVGQAVARLLTEGSTGGT
ncbi:AAA family ATPase [Variovorax sp. M-6]|uniref:AAA family ATPase n=1 Tax=Variovorax sp. M-6 TaxID=3233041 RepID=UPI003F998BD4